MSIFRRKQIFSSSEYQDQPSKVKKNNEDRLRVIYQSPSTLFTLLFNKDKQKDTVRSAEDKHSDTFLFEKGEQKEEHPHMKVTERTRKESVTQKTEKIHTIQQWKTKKCDFTAKSDH